MIKSLDKYMHEYQKQLQIGSIQKAYKGLMDYMMALRIHFISKYPKNFVPGSMNHGYMDITYFSFTPSFLKNKKLKIIIAFNHQKMQFGTWLLGQNKLIQKEYWELLKNRNWNSNYQTPLTSQESILGVILADSPNFSELSSLTAQIEAKTML